MERDITKAIRFYLAMQGIWHWKVWQGLGSKPGIADIIGIFQGKPLAIEIKTERGKLSESQAKFLARFRLEGGIAFVARSVEDVINALQGASKPQGEA